MPSPPSLPRAKSCSPPQSPPPEEMTQQDWEEVFEIEYQWAEERYQSFQKKLHDLMGDRKTYELSDNYTNIILINQAAINILCH